MVPNVKIAKKICCKSVGDKVMSLFIKEHKKIQIINKNMGEKLDIKLSFQSFP